MKRGVSAFAKSIDSGQPAQSAQADLGRTFWLSLHVSACNKTLLLQNSVSYLIFSYP